MNTIPICIMHYIYDYIPYKYKAILNKENYIKYNQLQRKMIPRSVFNGYIRHMVRRDNDFVLKFILHEYQHKWNKKIKFIYKNSTYHTYNIYLMHYSMELQAIKCYTLLKETNNTDIKQHKKVRSKKYKWIL